MDTGNTTEVVEDLQRMAPRQEETQDSLLKEEVKKALQMLKHHKSPGTDGIVAEALQAGGDRLEEELYGIMERVWSEEVIPTEWAKSVIVTIPKKGDLRECANYRTISLMNHMCKILMKIIQSRLQARVEPYLAEEQAGFRKDRSTVQQILILKLMAEQAWQKRQPIYNCFIDFSKAFDTIKHDVTWAVMDSFGVDGKITRLLQNIYRGSVAAVRVGQQEGEWFVQTIRTRQGDPVSPVIFITYLERVMDAEQDERQGVCISGEFFDNLRFADDIDLMELDLEKLQRSLNSVSEAASTMGLRINIAKTKVMISGNQQMTGTLKLEHEEIESVDQFIYLGSLITWDNDDSKEIRRRIGVASGAMAGFSKIWRSKEIRIHVKLEVLRSCVFSTLLYAAETWTLRKADQERLLAFEMKCYRRILNIRWQQRIKNTEVRRRMKAETNVLQMIIKRKMEFFGHVCRMGEGRMVKKVMWGNMHGTNRKGRPRKQWLDDITEWGRADLPTLCWETRSREVWRKRVRRAVDTNGR
jgi:hypothetical protein